MRPRRTLHPRLRVSMGVAIVPWAIMMSSSAPTFAQTTKTSTLSRNAPITLDVVDADVRDVLDHIARAGGIVIAVTNGVQQRVDLQLNGVPAHVALDLVLRTANLRGEMIGDVLVVRPPEPVVVREAAPDPVVVAPPRPEDDYPVPSDDLRAVLAGKDHTGTPPGPPKEAAEPKPSAEPGQERPVPNYDGRDPQAASAGEILAWVPRVVLFPVHVVLNYVVRIPIVWTLTRMEEYYVFKRVERFLSFRDGKSTVFPTFFGDFGLRPAVGISNNNRDLFFAGNDLSLYVGYGGDDFVRAGFNNATTVLSDDSGTLTLTGSFLTRPDQPFYGQGPYTSTDNRYNYGVRRFDVGWQLQAVLADLSWIKFSQALRDVDFDGDAINDEVDDLAPAPLVCSRDGYQHQPAPLEPDPDNPGASRRAAPSQPCGFDDGGYRLLESRIEAKIDTRNPDIQYRAGSGFLFEAFSSFEFDPTNLSRSFIRFGGEAAGFWDFSKVGHTLAFRIYSEFTERTGSADDPIPFTELASLGGLENMRGFLPRRFVGDSAFMATLSYRYPIWSLLDAEVFTSIGNVFDGHYANWALDRHHLNSGISLRTNFTRDTALQILFAVGTNRFEEMDDDNFQIDSIRFAFGVAQGF